MLLRAVVSNAIRPAALRNVRAYTEGASGGQDGQSSPQSGQAPRAGNFGMAKATILGNVGGVPNVITTSGDVKFATFAVATNSAYKDTNTGERHVSTEWHNIVVSNPNLVDYVSRNLKKGTRVYLEGAIRTKVSTTPQGQQIRQTKIIVGSRNSQIIVVRQPQAPKEEESVVGEDDDMF